MRRAVVLTALALGLSLAPPAGATPPTLLSAASQSGVATATWTLPAGGEDWQIEVATAPTLTPDGDFPAANVVEAEVFGIGSAVTKWTGTVVLDAGTYYVHVAGSDPRCAACGLFEWSAVKSFTVGAAATPTPTAVVAPAAPTPSVAPVVESMPVATPVAAATPTPVATPITTTAVTTATAATLTRVVPTRRGVIESIRLDLCAGSGGRAALRVVETLTRGSKLVATQTSTRVLDGLSGCGSYTIGWHVSPRLAGAGMYAVAVTLAR